jgi:hypothetical protein
LQNKTLTLPADVPLTKNGEPQPPVIVGDEAFLPKSHLLRPHSKNNATGNEENGV